MFLDLGVFGGMEDGGGSGRLSGKSLLVPRSDIKVALLLLSAEYERFISILLVFSLLNFDCCFFLRLWVRSGAAMNWGRKIKLLQNGSK